MWRNVSVEFRVKNSLSIFLKMELRNEIITAFQLLGLVSLLIWSLTWNLPPESDEIKFHRKISQKEIVDNRKAKFDFHGKPFSPTWDKYSIILDSFKMVNYVGSKFTKDFNSENSMLPPFNVWKEVELTKQGHSEPRPSVPEKSPNRRRKLNYASAKCGAKILASNSEAKYRMHILNEKIDEYMLNPCKVKMWFIVELCDTIETTQIELANYELYSSTPKQLTVSWSDVYPTPIWHPIGVFEAKDQRTMQSFDVFTKNLGKFIKVTIRSHYGHEHYCPLSIFRVLGYSMVYEYDDIDVKSEENNRKKTEADMDTIPRNVKMTENSAERTSNHGLQKLRRTQEQQPDSVSLLSKMTQQERLFFCSKLLNSQKRCLNMNYCVFLQRTILLNKNYFEFSEKCGRKDFEFSDHESHVENYTPVTKNQSTSNSRPKNDFTAIANYSNQSSDSENSYQELMQRIYTLSNNKVRVNASDIHPSRSKKMNETVRDTILSSKLAYTESKDTVMKNKDTFTAEHKNIRKQTSTPYNVQECECSKHAKNSESSESDSGALLKEYLPSDESTESAALIQKESVLVKLTMRIKTSEVNLNLINRYLQELSEFYRQKMDDMQVMFNGTVKALRIASEKAAAIDRQQQVSIEKLESRMSTLNKKLDYLVQGQENIWKQVLELHGFFVIMECIIMSTIFSIVLNKLRKSEFRIQ